MSLEKVDPKIGESKPRLQVEIINYAGTAPPKVRPNGKKGRDRNEIWKKQVERDPWLEESLNVLADMIAARS